jgi:sulfate transport system ATP-binding protein
VLLLDEPFGALDAQVRRELRRWLREMHDETGHTTVFVTHDQEEALELADRVVVMSQGRIEQVGTADDVYDRPNSPFVCGFIGESSNLSVTVDHGRMLLEGKPLPLARTDCPDGPAQLFLRPHDVDIVDGNGHGIKGRITGLRRHADTRRVELTLDGKAERIEVDVPAEVNLGRGDELTVLPRKWHVFPQDAERRN